MRFSLSWDRTTKIVSAACIGVFLVVAVLTNSLIVAGLGLLVGLGSYAWSPRSYLISADGITVKRLIGDVFFPFTELHEVRRATPHDLAGSVRLFGNGGLFGYYGLFRSPALGVCSWYVTNRRNIVVAVGVKTALFSPDDIDGFLAAIPQLAPGPYAPRPVEAKGRGLTLVLGLAFAALVLTFVVLALTWSPGPPSYTFADGSLTIHDRFYPVTLKSRDVDLAHVGIVDIDSNSDWHPVSRTNGFANLRYRSGWFRVANGQKVRLYVADAKRLVLLPPKGEGSPVLLQVREPRSFIDQFKRSATTTGS
jgi:hypothetical protein